MTTCPEPGKWLGNARKTLLDPGTPLLTSTSPGVSGQAPLTCPTPKWENGVQGSPKRMIQDVEGAWSGGVEHRASVGSMEGFLLVSPLPATSPAKGSLRVSSLFSESWYNGHPEQSAMVRSYPNREAEAGPRSQGVARSSQPEPPAIGHTFS